jgi:hypothetical protein
VVDKEFELLKLGFANNYDEEKKNLDLVEKQREEARKKGEDLARKAARRQIIIDTAQQVAALATSAANILKGTSSVPIVGIALGIGLIATLLTTFQKFKANAAKFAEAPKLKEGGALGELFSGEVKGASHSGGGVPANMAGRQIELEGKEMVVNALDAQQHLPLLKDINRGKYRGMDIEVAPSQSVGRMLPGITKASKEAVEAKIEMEFRAMSQAMETAFGKHLEKHGEKIVGAIRGQKVIKPLRDGGWIEEWSEGGTKVTKKVKETA